MNVRNMNQLGVSFIIGLALLARMCATESDLATETAEAATRQTAEAKALYEKTGTAYVETNQVKQTRDAPTARAQETLAMVATQTEVKHMAATLGPLPEPTMGWLCLPPSPDTGGDAVCIHQQDDTTGDAVTCGSDKIASDQSAELTRYVGNAAHQKDGKWNASFAFDLGTIELVQDEWNSSTDAQGGTISWTTPNGDIVKVTLSQAVKIPVLSLIVGSNYMFARLPGSYSSALEAANALDALLSGASVSSQVGTTCDSLSVK
jgi:hypothetical protein